ncbi:MAG: hypothetical protein HZB14_05035 [Actinobacteria bacterium]|nr:hypothetical protein [Actinomycetota bacterium]
MPKFAVWLGLLAALCILMALAQTSLSAVLVLPIIASVALFILFLGTSESKHDLRHYQSEENWRRW